MVRSIPNPSEQFLSPSFPGGKQNFVDGDAVGPGFPGHVFTAEQREHFGCLGKWQTS